MCGRNGSSVRVGSWQQGGTIAVVNCYVLRAARAAAVVVSWREVARAQPEHGCATCFLLLLKKTLVLAEISFAYLQHIPAEEASARAVKANCILLRATILKEGPLHEKALRRICSSSHGVYSSGRWTLARLRPGFFAAFALLGTRGDSQIPLHSSG